MTEQELADQFGQDVDALLQGHRPQPVDAAPDYRMALDLAKALATTDLSGESDQRLALRRRLLEQVNAPSKLASAPKKAITAWIVPVVQRLPALCGVLLAIGIIHLAWSGDLHRGASGFGAALHENLMSVYASLPAVQPEPAAPITTTAGLPANPWPAFTSPEALATSQVPANSTTVALGNVMALGLPPK